MFSVHQTATVTPQRRGSSNSYLNGPSAAVHRPDIGAHTEIQLALTTAQQLSLSCQSHSSSVDTNDMRQFLKQNKKLISKPTHDTKRTKSFFKKVLSVPVLLQHN